MKKIFLSCLLAFLLGNVFAQKNVIKDKSPEAVTEQLVAKYNLTPAQEAKMLKIQTRKVKNLNEFATLENSNFEKYIQKASNNENQTRYSMRLILNKEQIEILNEEEATLRRKRAGLSARMQKNGATSTEIKKALLELE